MYISCYKYPLLFCALHLACRDATLLAIIARYSSLLSESCWHKERLGVKFMKSDKCGRCPIYILDCSFFILFLKMV